MNSKINFFRPSLMGTGHVLCVGMFLLGVAAQRAGAAPAPANIPQVDQTTQTVSIEVNGTTEHKDDLAELNGDTIPCTIKLKTAQGNDLVVKLSNADGRLTFGGIADLNNVTLPKDGTAVNFTIKGTTASAAIDDAKIVANAATGNALVGSQSVSVFWFDAVAIDITQGNEYKKKTGPLAALTDAPAGNFENYAPDPFPAVTIEASATLKPAGLDTTASPLKDLQIGIVQNALTFNHAAVFGTPVEYQWGDNPPVNIGQDYNAPKTVTMNQSITAAALDVNIANPADPNNLANPLYSPGTPIQAVGATVSEDQDSPHTQFGLWPVWNAAGDDVDATFLYTSLNSAVYNDTFKDWVVRYNNATSDVKPLLMRGWTLSANSANANQFAVPDTNAATATAPIITGNTTSQIIATQILHPTKSVDTVPVRRTE